jgi:hypothetical protein
MDDSSFSTAAVVSSTSITEPIKISYPTLLSSPESLLADIGRAFGSEDGCLGIILISGTTSSLPHHSSQEQGLPVNSTRRWSR